MLFFELGKAKKTFKTLQNQPPVPCFLPSLTKISHTPPHITAIFDKSHPSLWGRERGLTIIIALLTLRVTHTYSQTNTSEIQ